MERQNFDAIKYTNSPQWREMLSEWKNRGNQWLCRICDEEQDADFIKMRMIAILGGTGDDGTRGK
jgi:hypothetical protein